MGSGPVHSRVGPLPADPGTARRGAALHSPSPAPPTASGAPAACRLLPPAGTLARRSWHGPEGSCFALPKPCLAPVRQAVLLPPAVLICIRRAVGLSTQEWDPSPPLRARPGGELLWEAASAGRLRRPAAGLRVRGLMLRPAAALLQSPALALVARSSPFTWCATLCCCRPPPPSASWPSRSPARASARGRPPAFASSRAGRPPL